MIKEDRIKRDAKMLQLYLRGTNPRDIAKKLRMSFRHVYERLKRLGVKFPVFVPYKRRYDRA